MLSVNGFSAIQILLAQRIADDAFSQQFLGEVRCDRGTSWQRRLGGRF
jgi:hypothetical protein